MTDDNTPSRRRFLAASGIAATGIGLSGCSFLEDSGSSPDEDEEDEPEDTPSSDGTTAAPTTTDSDNGNGNGDPLGQGDVRIGERYRGQITEDSPSDPHYNDLSAEVTFMAEAGRGVRIIMEASQFDAFLLITGPNGERIGQNDDGDAVDGTDSSFTFVPQQNGLYTIWAGSVSGTATGSFTLRLEDAPEATPEPTPDDDGEDLREIALGQTRTGVIDQSDPSDPEYDGLAEPVTFQGQSGQTVTITMRSSPLDPLLVLYGPDGTYVAENDDFGTGFDSRIVVELEQTGTYTIWATTWEGTETGQYTLSLVEGGQTGSGDEAQDGPDLREISLGQTRSGFIDLSDPNEPEDNQPAEPVTFQGQSGQTVTITMESEPLDTLLVLYGPDGTYVTENDDIDFETFNSQIVVTLEQSGTYTIWATTYELADRTTGEYTLTLQEGDQSEDGGSGGGNGGSDRPDLRQISVGQTRTGYIDESDPSDPQYDGLAEPVEFDGQAGDTVTIRMESDPLDPLVVLYGPDGAYVAENDDYGDGFNSQLTVDLTQTGTYTIWATTWSGFATGEYTLSLSDGNTTA